MWPAIVAGNLTAKLREGSGSFKSHVGPDLDGGHQTCGEKEKIYVESALLPIAHVPFDDFSARPI